MPWKETTKVNEREEMIEKYENRYTVTELARHFGVSRPTVYLWIGRSEADEGLIDRPSIPGHCPHATDPVTVELLLKAKREKPHWGPVKQRARLAAAYPDRQFPAASTIGRIYANEGLVSKRKTRPRSIPMRRLEQVVPSESGEMMSCDHKGWFRLGNRQYCYPLTIADPFSRYIYAIDALESTSTEQAKPVFTRVFREYGLPLYMLSDNGGPFCCSRALAGLTPLAVWWLKLGILLVRIRKASPWENGIHERMHKTLKAETTRPPEKQWHDQQKRFDTFRAEFNQERPHEAVGNRPPITMFARSPRPYLESAAKHDPEYPAHFEMRRVRSGGEIKWKGRAVFLTESLAGEQVGLEEVDDGVWSVHFTNVELGRYDEKTRLLV